MDAMIAPTGDQSKKRRLMWVIIPAFPAFNIIPGLPGSRLPWGLLP
jgi:hypothetical protein